MWQLSRSKQNKLPLYQQVVNLIEQLIEQGMLHNEQRLPSERQLAELLEVNRSTIIHALEQLTDRGILIRKVGSGTYVNPAKWGLQCHPIINWQPHASRFNHQSDHYTQCVQQQLQQPNNQLCNLANGDLPADLLPSLTISEFSLQHLIQQEQTLEASHLGLTSLKLSVQDYLKKSFSFSVPLEEILITSGTQQAIFLLTQGLLKPGDAIGIEAPSYFYSLPLFQAAGLRIYAIPMDQQGITLSGLDQLKRRYDLKMIFLNPVFQNPTGLVMSKQRKKELLNYCYIKRIPIVEDDAYSALSFHPHIDTTPIKQLDKNQQVIYMGSLSKYLGKSIRAGWMIAPEAMLKKLANIRQQLDAGLSVLPQLLAEHYLHYHSQQHQVWLKKQLALRADTLYQWLKVHYDDRLQFSSPIGGYHLYATSISKSKESIDKLLQDLLNDRIVVMRGSDFGDSMEHFRFSFAHFK